MKLKCEKGTMKSEIIKPIEKLKMYFGFGKRARLTRLSKLFSIPNDTCIGKIRSKKSLIYSYRYFNMDNYKDLGKDGNKTVIIHI